MMRLSRTLAVAILCFSFAYGVSAKAELFLGAGVVAASNDYDDVGSGTGYKLFGGYLHEGLYGLELAHFDSGDMAVDELGDLRHEVWALSLLISVPASGTLPLSGGVREGWIVSGRLGAYHMRTTLRGGNGRSTDDGVSWLLGADLGYKFNRSFQLRAGVDLLGGAPDLADERLLVMFNAGASFHF